MRDDPDRKDHSKRYKRILKILNAQLNNGCYDDFYLFQIWPNEKSDVSARKFTYNLLHFKRVKSH